MTLTAPAAITERNTKRQGNLGAPWQPGQSGNPNGRPPGLMRYIREHSGDGQTLAESVLQILQGKVPAGFPADRLTRDDWWRAVEWLSDRGWGRPQQAPAVAASETRDAEGNVISQSVTYSYTLALGDESAPTE